MACCFTSRDVQLALKKNGEGYSQGENSTQHLKSKSQAPTHKLSLESVVTMVLNENLMMLQVQLTSDC